MTEPQSDDTTLARRNLIRGGAVLAGAAGLTAAGAVLAPKANAANGDAVTAGNTTTANGTTTLANSSSAPTLTINNTSAATATNNAPVLQLSTRNAYAASDTLPTLAPGQYVSTQTGPYLGISDGSTTATGYLATNYDLDTLPLPLPITPQRLLDTRYSGSRVFVRASSGNPFNTAGQLNANTWIDVPVGGVTDEEVLNAGFFNLTAVGPTGNGYLLAYPPDPTRPNSSTVNFSKGINLSNGAFVGIGLYADIYIVRVFTSAVTHVILDLTGITVQGPTAPLPPSSVSGQKASRKRGPASRRMVRVSKKR